MSVRSRALAVLFSTSVLASACGGGSQPAAPAASDPAPINDVRTRYMAAYNAGDAAAVAALFAEDAVSMPDHRPVIEGRAAIQKDLEQAFSQFTMNMVVTPIDTEVLGEVAHEHGTFAVTMTPKAGGAAMSDTGKYLVVLKRENGTWLLHHDMDNSNAPPAAPPAVAPAP